MPKDRGAEQGDVDGPLECSLALGMVAAETWRRVAAEQAAGSLPWISVNDPSEEQRLRADHATRMQESANFQLGGPKSLPVPTTRTTRCRKTEAWQTCGTLMTATSAAWRRLSSLQLLHMMTPLERLQCWRSLAIFPASRPALATAAAAAAASASSFSKIF